jgi:hypothetical protein
VRELVHALRRSRPTTQPALPVEAATAAVPAALAPAPPLWGLALAGGVRGAPLSERVQWGAGLAAGAFHRAQRVRLVGLLELTWFPEIELARGPAHVRLVELAPGLQARAELQQGDLWLGAHGGLALSFVKARGTDGRERGEARKKVLVALLGLHAELQIAGGFGLLASLGVQLKLHRQRFTVNGAELLDLGRLRPIGTLALSFRWPQGP